MSAPSASARPAGRPPTGRTRRRRAAVVLALCTAVVAVLLPGLLVPAEAAAPAGPLTVHLIDGTNPKAVKVSFSYPGPASDLKNLKLSEDGNGVSASAAVPISEAKVSTATSFVIDRSSSLGDSSQLAAITSAIKDIVQARPAGELISVVGYADNVTVYQQPTTDKSKVMSSLDSLSDTKGSKSAQWDALHKGAALLQGQPDTQTQVILVTNGVDDVSTTNAQDSSAALTQANAALYVAGVGPADALAKSSLGGLATESGGYLTSAPTVDQAPSAVATIGKNVDGQYAVTYASHVTQGQASIHLTVGNASTQASFVMGAVANGSVDTSVQQASSPWLPAILRGDVGKFLALAIIAVALGLGAYAVAHLMAGEDSSLQSVLQPYAYGYHPDDAQMAEDQSLAQTALLQRAVQMTEDFAERQGFLSKVEDKLERANLPLRAAEFMFFSTAAVVIVGLAAIALQGLTMGIIFLVIAALIPGAVLSYLAKRREKAFNAQLPDMLQLLSGSLRAGYSFMQGVEAVSTEVPEPMGRELRRVVTEARLGRELEEALDGVAARMNSRDFEWAVMAVRIQREVGGNLAELLLTVADTMTARERLRRDVAGLTAEGRISAIVIGLLPPGLGMAMYVMNHDYMAVLFSDGRGIGMLVGAGIAMLIGFYWMKKTVDIEI